MLVPDRVVGGAKQLPANSQRARKSFKGYAGLCP